MPPLKTYTFENVNNPYISVVIKAYNYDGAVAKLTLTVINPKDFQTKP